VLPFLTAYDPLGGSSTSIDPLGALQSYGGLADLLLPGLTTITGRSRYLSMLCAALANAERHHPAPPGPAGLTLRRRAVLPLERLWALACVAAHYQGHDRAADGLRGFRRANRLYRELDADGRRATSDFQLLLSQERTGAVGTYWTVLVGGQLVHPDDGHLMPEGRALADEFREPPLSARDQKRIADPARAHNVTLDWGDLAGWAEACHLVAAERPERRQLAEALTADDRRDCVARAIAALNAERELPAEWGNQDLRRLQVALAAIPTAVALELPTVVEAILRVEEFHEAALAVFESLLWWGTQHAGRPLGELLAESVLRRAADRSRETARRLLEFRASCDVPAVQKALAGLIGFAGAVVPRTSAREVIDEVLRRHRRVQSGKLDGGMPKRDWVTLDGSRLIRPAPQFQRTEPPPVPVGRSLTHRYRLEPLVHMLRENDVLPRPIPATQPA
jgi:hypothetical protein